MGKAKKRKPLRGRKRPAPAAGRWWGRAWRTLLLLGGVVLGVMLPWVVYLNHQVTSEFEGRKWDLPSRVYARPLALYPGAPLTLSDLELELRLSGYRPTSTDAPSNSPTAMRTVAGSRPAWPVAWSTACGIQPAAPR
jgi:penicillin-binding protein 1B